MHLALQLITHKHINNKTINVFLEYLIVLLSKSEKNMHTFRKYIGLKSGVLENLFYRMILAKPTKYLPIYENSLMLLEVFIQSLKNETKSDENSSYCIELKNIFDFILILNFTEYSMQDSDIDTNVKVSMDILTLIFTHIIVNKENQV